MSTTIAELYYIVPTTQRPRSFTYAPIDGSPRTTVITGPHGLPIGDLRQEDGPFTLDEDGFAFVQHQSAVTDFTDESQICNIYFDRVKNREKNNVISGLWEHIACEKIS